MSLIKKSTELSTPSTVKLMVYGQAGMGKSTFALSAPKPLLLDFDGGVKRVNMEHLKGVDTVQVNNWGEILQVFQEDLSPYQTIVVDTIGKMLDYIITHKCGQRQPSIRDWGGINAEFSNFIRNISMLNKHVVFVAHRDTRKEGDETVFVPALREKSYNSIVTELDLLGYMETKTENGVTRRTITFDPTPRNDGKNTCNLPSVMVIPEIIDKQGNVKQENTMVETLIIRPYLNMLQKKKDEAKKFEVVMSQIKENIELITDAKSATDFAYRIDKFDHVGSSKAMASELLKKKAVQIGIKYNAKSKAFDPVKEKEVEQFNNSLL